MSRKNKAGTRWLAFLLSGMLTFSGGVPTFGAEITDETEVEAVENEETAISDFEAEETDEAAEVVPDSEEISVDEADADAPEEDFGDEINIEEENLTSDEEETEEEEEQNKSGAYDDDETEWAVKAEISSGLAEISYQQGSGALYVDKVTYKLTYKDGSTVSGKGKEYENYFTVKENEIYNWCLKASDGEIYETDLADEIPAGKYTLVLSYYCNGYIILGECRNCVVNVSTEIKWATKASLKTSVNQFCIPQGFGSIYKDFLIYEIEDRYGVKFTDTCASGIIDASYNHYELRLKTDAGQIYDNAPVGEYYIVLGYVDGKFVELASCKECRVTVVDPSKLVDKKLNAGSNEITATRRYGEKIKLYTFVPEETGTYYLTGDYYSGEYWDIYYDEEEDYNYRFDSKDKLELEKDVTYYFWFYYGTIKNDGNEKKYTISLDRKKEATNYEVIPGKTVYRTYPDTPYLSDWKLKVTYADQTVNEYRFDELWGYWGYPYMDGVYCINNPYLEDPHGLKDPYGNVIYGDTESLYCSNKAGTYTISLYKEIVNDSTSGDGEDWDEDDNIQKEIIGNYSITVKDSTEEELAGQKLHTGRNAVTLHQYGVFYKLPDDTGNDYIIKIPACDFVAKYEKVLNNDEYMYDIQTEYGSWFNKKFVKRIQLIEKTDDYYTLKIKPQKGLDMWLILSNEYGRKDDVKAEVEINPVDKCEHTYQLSETQEPTCVKSGKKIYTCSKCQESYEEKIPAKGHTAGKWKTVKEATVLSEGSQELKCAVCGAIMQTKQISKLKATITLNVPKTVPLKVKQSFQIKVSGLEKGDRVISWKSSKAKILTVSASGKIKGKKAGTAKVTVKLQSGLTSQIKVKVQKSTVAAKTITVLNKATNKKVSRSITLKVKEKLTLASVVAPVTCNQKITYSSSNKKVATVTKKGVIKAKKKGKTTITVKAGKKTVKIKIKVK
ncbi:Ig-like domain-containing protein [Blautia sp. HCP28S3_G10]|uniref:Ig-like domain-containing protein n=1 Tax=Blautia sp. HCP28S3_G10 TaxID=3438908 RepID=UPI003F8B8D57